MPTYQIDANTTYYKLWEIAKKYHLSPETVRLWVVRGILRDGERVTLPAIKIGGTWRVAEESILNWINDGIVSCTSPRLLVVA